MCVNAKCGRGENKKTNKQKKQIIVLETVYMLCDSVHHLFDALTLHERAFFIFQKETKCSDGHKQGWVVENSLLSFSNIDYGQKVHQCFNLKENSLPPCDWVESKLDCVPAEGCLSWTHSLKLIFRHSLDFDMFTFADGFCCFGNRKMNHRFCQLILIFSAVEKAIAPRCFWFIFFSWQQKVIVSTDM